jgi:hypothetical protein
MNLLPTSTNLFKNLKQENCFKEINKLNFRAQNSGYSFQSPDEKSGGFPLLSGALYIILHSAFGIAF